MIFRTFFEVTDTATVQNGILSIASGASATINAVEISGGILRVAGNTAATSLTIGPGGISASGGIVEVKISSSASSALLNLEGDVTTTGNFAFTTLNTSTALDQINLIGPRTFDIADGTITTVAPDFGDGTLIKTGSGTLALNGTLGAGGFALTANGGTTTIANSQTLASLEIGAGATVTLLEDLTPAPAASGGPADGGFGEVFAAGDAQVAAVPEPGVFGLLAAGALGLLRRRRS